MLLLLVTRFLSVAESDFFKLASGGGILLIAIAKSCNELLSIEELRLALPYL